MTLRSSQPQVTAAVLDAEQDASLFLTCPMCHTPASLMQSAVDAGADWRCVRCGQHWDAARLAAVVAYAAWVVDRVRVGRRGTERSQDPELYRRDPPTEPLGGTP